MSFREKLKKAFKGNSPTSSKSPSPTVVQAEARWPSNVYRPGEPMPRPKYRAPVKKEHKEKLEAFSFGAATLRKRSQQSQYSPMGSRRTSRRNSRASRLSGSGLPAGGRESMETRRRSVVSPTRDGFNGQDRRFRTSVRVVQQQSKLQTEPQNSGDVDVANVGISRINSNEKPPHIHINHASRDCEPLSPTSPVRHDLASRLSYLSNASSDGYFPARDQHRRSGENYSTSAASKADSGPTGQHIMSNLGKSGDGRRLFNEDDLAKAMSQSRMSATVLLV